MAEASVLSPLVPPQGAPADLVIDTFGTFLGKRSGRMIVRWREPVRFDFGPDPFGPNEASSFGANSSSPAAAGASTNGGSTNRAAGGGASAGGAGGGAVPGTTAGARGTDRSVGPAVLRFPDRSDAGDSSETAPADVAARGAVSVATMSADVSQDAAAGSPGVASDDHEVSDGPSGEVSSDRTGQSDETDDRDPDAVAARLLSLWSRRRPASKPSSRAPSKRGARAPNRPSPRTDGPHDGTSDDARPEDRFRRLDSALRDLDAKFDDTPGTQWRHREVPLDRLKSVVVASRGVTISTDLVEALVERGVALSFLSSRGVPVAHLTAPALAATVQTRRAQLAVYSTRLGVELAAAFIDGKLRNQRHTLLYFGKYLKATAPDRYRVVFEKAKSLHAMRRQLRDTAGSSPRRAADAPLIEVLRDRLMGLEGAAARCYWEAVAVVLAGRVDFPGRNTRGALDPVNAALNYGYGILYSQVFGAVVNAGLEPYAGFLHVDRPGKPSLVLDLVEEFRAPVVDRAVLAIVNQGVPLDTDDHGLTAPTRRVVADRVLERLNKPVPFEGKRHRLRSILQMQARHLATAVRGERVYKPFCSRW